MREFLIKAHKGHLDNLMKQIQDDKDSLLEMFNSMEIGEVFDEVEGILTTTIDQIQQLKMENEQDESIDWDEEIKEHPTSAPTIQENVDDGLENIKSHLTRMIQAKDELLKYDIAHPGLAIQYLEDKFSTWAYTLERELEEARMMEDEKVEPSFENLIPLTDKQYAGTKCINDVGPLGFYKWIDEFIRLYNVDGWKTIIKPITTGELVTLDELNYGAPSKYDILGHVHAEMISIKVENVSNETAQKDIIQQLVHYQEQNYFDTMMNIQMPDGSIDYTETFITLNQPVTFININK